jgi:hypothetical protein
VTAGAATLCLSGDGHVPPRLTVTTVILHLVPFEILPYGAAPETYRASPYHELPVRCLFCGAFLSGDGEDTVAYHGFCILQERYARAFFTTGIPCFPPARLQYAFFLLPSFIRMVLA